MHKNSLNSYCCGSSVPPHSPSCLQPPAAGVGDTVMQATCRMVSNQIQLQTTPRRSLPAKDTTQNYTGCTKGFTQGRKARSASNAVFLGTMCATDALQAAALLAALQAYSGWLYMLQLQLQGLLSGPR